MSKEANVKSFTEAERIFTCDKCKKTIFITNFVKEWTIARNPKKGKSYSLCPECSKSKKNIKEMSEALGY